MILALAVEAAGRGAGKVVKVRDPEPALADPDGSSAAPAPVGAPFDSFCGIDQKLIFVRIETHEVACK